MTSRLTTTIREGEDDKQKKRTGRCCKGDCETIVSLSFEGDGGHAGAQLMHLRNDAVVAGSKLAVAVEEFAKNSGSTDTVATVGGFTVKPNAINSVPRSAVLEIDVRDIDLKRRDLVVEQITTTAKKVAAERNGIILQ